MGLVIGLCVCAHVQSCPALCDPMNCCPPGSSLHGILQARILEWVAISFSRGPCWSRDWTRVSYLSCIGRQSLYQLRHLGMMLIGNKMQFCVCGHDTCAHTHAHSHTLAHTWEWVVRAVMFHRKLLGGGFAWTRSGRIKGKPWAGTKWAQKVRWEQLVGDSIKSAYESQEFWLSPKQGAITDGMWPDQIRSVFNRLLSCVVKEGEEGDGTEMRRSCHKSGMYVLCLCCFYSNLKARSPLTFISYIASAQLRARSRHLSIHHLCYCSYKNMRPHRFLSDFSQNRYFCTYTHSVLYLHTFLFF